MLLPEGSISIEIDKRIAGTKHRYGLRKRRDYDQKDLCHRLNLQNVYFYKNKDEFEINQHFLISNGLKRNLMDRTLSVTYCPYMKLELERNDLFKIKSTNKTFEVSYFKDSDKKYLKYLSMSLKAKSDFYIFPELAISNADIDNVTKTIKECNLKHECIIVAGSDWKKKRNTCYVFNQKGKLLLKQDKYIPYEIKDSEEDLICLEKQEINLLNIRNVGLFAFPICADMLSEKYIGNVFCQCKVTNLIISCFSKSNDIYDSLSHLSSNYWMVNFACNSPIGKNKVVGYQSTPYKKPHSSKRSYREEYISLSKIKYPRFNETIKSITRKVKI